MGQATRSPDPTLADDAQRLRDALTDLIRVYQFRDRDRICCHDVSVRQSNALDVLTERGAVTLNGLAAELYLDKSTTSRVVDALEKKGYARREENPSSKRSILVEATPAGRSLQRQIREDLLAEETQLLAAVDPETRRTTADLIGRLARLAAARVDASQGTCSTLG